MQQKAHIQKLRRTERRRSKQTQIQKITLIHAYTTNKAFYFLYVTTYIKFQGIRDREEKV